MNQSTEFTVDSTVAESNLAPVNQEVSAEDLLPFELEALANAKNYQSWIFDLAQPFLGKRILEIGAGIGNISQWLPVQEKLILSEADPVLFKILQKNFDRNESSKAPVKKPDLARFDVVNDSIEPYVTEALDTIISFNVLEHIENDARALTRMCQILKKSTAPGKKRLICFVPAHNWAFGSLDKTFGHFRRYSKSSITELAQHVAPEAKLYTRYFNTFGLLGWIVQGKIMSRRNFGLSSVKTFEKLCPLFRAIDTFLHRVFRLPLGQSLLAVMEWEN